MPRCKLAAPSLTGVSSARKAVFMLVSTAEQHDTRSARVFHPADTPDRRSPLPRSAWSFTLIVTFAAAPPASLFHPKFDQHTPVLERPALPQFLVDLPAHAVEQRNA